MKNGITTEDLQKSFKEGFDEGFSAASPEITKTAYAAVVLALRQEFGFGRERCKRALIAMNNHILNTLDSIEAIDKVYDEIGLILKMDNPLEPVQEVEPCERD